MTLQYEQEGINLAADGSVTFAQTLVAGNATGGRNIVITVGDSITTLAGTGGAAGVLLGLLAGDGDGAGTGGAFFAAAGVGGATGDGGIADINGGDAGAAGNGGNANLGAGDANVGDGGNVNVAAGAANTGNGGNVLLVGGVGSITNGGVFIPAIKSGSTQGAAGALAGELWKTATHATLPDNVILIGV